MAGIFFNQIIFLLNFYFDHKKVCYPFECFDYLHAVIEEV